MASELIVQTIQGPSSGANANKVLIPSGHTLDVSGGTFTPSSGQVVQEQIFQDSTVATWASGSQVKLFPTTLFTKQFDESTSKLIIQAQIPVNGGWSYANAPYVRFIPPSGSAFYLWGYGVHIDTATANTNVGSVNKAVQFQIPITTAIAGTHQIDLWLQDYNTSVYGSGTTITVNPTNSTDARYPPTNYSTMIVREVML